MKLGPEGSPKMRTGKKGREPNQWDEANAHGSNLLNDANTRGSNLWNALTDHWVEPREEKQNYSRAKNQNLL